MTKFEEELERTIKEFIPIKDYHFITDLIPAIKELIKKRIVPSERKERFVVGAQDSGDWVMTEEAEGHNSCRTEILKRLE